MDQIFDRLEQLFKSWVAPDADKTATRNSHGFGDPDLDAAMSELDDFLDKDRGAAEARAREREQREKTARERAYSSKPASDRPPSGPPALVVEAYKTLGLPFGAPFPQAKAAYKKLLLRYHPDRNSASPAEQKRATEISAHINAAYVVIEAWTTTGKLPKE